MRQKAPASSRFGTRTGRPGVRRGVRGISGALRGISGADWFVYAAIAAVSLGIGIVNALSAAQDVAWRGGSL